MERRTVTVPRSHPEIQAYPALQPKKKKKRGRGNSSTIQYKNQGSIIIYEEVRKNVAELNDYTEKSLRIGKSLLKNY